MRYLMRKGSHFALCVGSTTEIRRLGYDDWKTAKSKLKVTYLYRREIAEALGLPISCVIVDADEIEEIK